MIDYNRKHKIPIFFQARFICHLLSILIITRKKPPLDFAYKRFLEAAFMFIPVTFKPFNLHHNGLASMYIYCKKLFDIIRNILVLPILFPLRNI